MLNRRGFFFLCDQGGLSSCFCSFFVGLWPACGSFFCFFIWECSGLVLGSARLGGYTLANGTPLWYSRMGMVRSHDRSTDVGEVD